MGRCAGAGIALVACLAAVSCTQHGTPTPPGSSATGRTPSTPAVSPATPTRPAPPDSGGAMDGDEPGGGPSGTPVAPTGNPERATATPAWHPLPPGAAGTPRGARRNAAAQVSDRSDADQVATAFAVRLDLWDTRIDHRPNDAAKRAAVLATAAFRRKMLDGAPVAAPGARWNALAAHHGWTTVTARLGGLGEPPSDSPTLAWRVVTTTATDHGDRGWRGAGGSTTYAVKLVRTRTGNPWYVANYRLL